MHHGRRRPKSRCNNKLRARPLTGAALFLSIVAQVGDDRIFEFVAVVMGFVIRVRLEQITDGMVRGSPDEFNRVPFASIWRLINCA